MPKPYYMQAAMWIWLQVGEDHQSFFNMYLLGQGSNSWAIALIYNT